MKIHKIVLTLAVSTFLAFTSGCDKKDSATEANATSDSENTISSVTAEVKETAQQAATEVKEATARVTTEVKETTTSATSAAAAKLESLKAESQNLIEKARNLVNDKKYEEALASLKQLSNLSLTPEQQKTVDDLKATIQKLMSSQVVTNAASALGNMLNK